MSNLPPQLEALEPRQLFNHAIIEGITPQQARHAYGFDQISFLRRNHYQPADGSWQTIAIVDAFSSPTVWKDLKTFDKQFGLPDTDAYGQPVLTIAQPQGTPKADGPWASEVALDVEWVHAIAPKAHILLVEAKDDFTDSLNSAIDWARQQPGVVAVSLSWGGDPNIPETNNDSILTTPRRHIGGAGLRGGVTFVTGSGDNGPVASWPANSPNVVTVGGTSLSIDTTGNWLNETAWAGSGGGTTHGNGTFSPDVAYDGNPDTGFAVYDSTDDGTGIVGWNVIGGTSAGTPQWAALISIANQGRSLRGRGSLDGVSQTLPAIYAMPATHFHDITTGSNGGFSAGPGYDLITGRGTPRAERVIDYLVKY